MCRGTDHSGRRCPASKDKAKRSEQNRAYYQSHKKTKAKKLTELGTLKASELPSKKDMQAFLRQMNETQSLNAYRWYAPSYGFETANGENVELLAKGDAFVKTIKEAFNVELSNGDFEYSMEPTSILMYGSDVNMWGLTNPFRINLEGSVNDAKGKKIGSWQRAVFFPEDEAPYAEYHYFYVSDKIQGNGVGSKSIGFFDNTMKSWGVENVHVEANIDVGGYAWAKSGYDWDTNMGNKIQGGDPDPKRIEKEWDAQQKKIAKHIDFVLAKNKITPDAETLQLVERLKQPYDVTTYPLPFDIANLGRSNTWVDEEGRTMWLGKEVMLGSSWMGLRKL